jgi:hypothetical protein
VGVRENDDVGQFFQTLKGLRHGCPIFPILFNVVADMFATLIARSKEKC